MPLAAKAKNKSHMKFLKTSIAVLCLCYCGIAWVLPILLAVFFTELPYLQKFAFGERFAISSGFSIVMLIVTAFLWPRNFLVYKAPKRLGTVKNVLMAFSGLVMFTFSSAWLSGNIFGSFVKLTPGTEYEERLLIKDVAYRGVRYRAVTLLMERSGESNLMYLTLAKRLFNYPEFKVGESIMLHGKENIFGVYVDSFTVIPN